MGRLVFERITSGGFIAFHDDLKVVIERRAALTRTFANGALTIEDRLPDAIADALQNAVNAVDFAQQGNISVGIGPQIVSVTYSNGTNQFIVGPFGPPARMPPEVAALEQAAQQALAYVATPLITYGVSDQGVLDAAGNPRQINLAIWREGAFALSDSVPGNGAPLTDDRGQLKNGDLDTLRRALRAGEANWQNEPPQFPANGGASTRDSTIQYAGKQVEALPGSQPDPVFVSYCAALDQTVGVIE